MLPNNEFSFVAIEAMASLIIVTSTNVFQNLKGFEKLSRSNLLNTDNMIHQVLEFRCLVAIIPTRLLTVIQCLDRQNVRKTRRL